MLEKSAEILKMINSNTEFKTEGYKIAVAKVSNYSNNRKVYECIAFK
jgi:hypothetical protein